MHNIIILGGGTAGWLTALTVQKYYPEKNITLIQSKKIGVIGAGEGTVPYFINVCKFLDLPIIDLFKYSDATIKLGIAFKDWHTINNYFMHDFNADAPQNLRLYEKLNNKNTNDIEEYLLAVANNKTIFKEDDLLNLNDSFDKKYALHFNAIKLADYLEEVGKQRGINVVDGVYESVDLDEQDYIKNIKLEDGNIIPCDFIFDCSGFARLLIDKVYNVEWKSYSDNLPLDKAIAFFQDHDNNVPPVTEAIALNNGWAWKIPVKDRYGCGYVYNSKYCTQEEAIEEVKQIFGDNIKFGKNFSFEPGTFTKTVVKNCMAVGLSQSFFEPLEATNIWVSTANVQLAIHSNLLNCRLNDYTLDVLNTFFSNKNDEIADFLYLHYYGSDRNDSDFWRDFKEKYPPTNSFLKTYNSFKQSFYIPPERHSMFNGPSWLQMLSGLDLYSEEELLLHTKYFNFAEAKEHRRKTIQINKEIVNRYLSHLDLIHILNK